MVKRVVSMKPNAAHREVQLDVAKMIIDASLIEKGGATKNMDEADLLEVLDEVENRLCMITSKLMYHALLQHIF